MFSMSCTLVSVAQVRHTCIGEVYNSRYTGVMMPGVIHNDDVGSVQRSYVHPHKEHLTVHLLVMITR